MRRLSCPCDAEGTDAVEMIRRAGTNFGILRFESLPMVHAICKKLTKVSGTRKPSLSRAAIPYAVTTPYDYSPQNYRACNANISRPLSSFCVWLQSHGKASCTTRVEIAVSTVAVEALRIFRSHTSAQKLS